MVCRSRRLINMINKSIANTDKIHFKKNVIGVTVGTKIVNGVDTGTDCIVVEVKSKENTSVLSSNDIIPSKLSDGTITDVIEISEVYALGTCPTNSSACSAHGDVNDTLKGGTACGRSNWVGTLGAIVRDTTDNSLVCLTNAHVTGLVYDAGGYNWDTDSLGLSSKYPSCNTPETSASNYGRMMYQPYYGATGAYDVGLVKKAVPLRFNITGTSVVENFVDASIFKLDAAYASGNLPSPILEDSMVLGRHINTAPLFDFSDIEEIDTTNICVKIGRTTGRTTMRPDPTYVEGVNGVILDSDYTVNVRYCSGSTETEYTIPFIHTLKIGLSNYDASTTDGWKFSNSGDSGSVCFIWNTSNNRWEILGLVFAGGGSEGSAFSVVCRIDYICKQLGIGENWEDSGTYTFENYASGSYLTVLPDVSASTGVWDGSIRVDKTINHDYMKVNYDNNEQTVCYKLSSGSYSNLSHNAGGRTTFSSSTSGTCRTLDIGWGTYGGNNVFTVNGVSAAELHLERGQVYTFNLDSDVRSGGTHPFQIEKPIAGGTEGPWTTSSVDLSATTTEAVSSWWRYTCQSHGSGMGNKIFFKPL
jgi:hypothetical protein